VVNKPLICLCILCLFFSVLLSCSIASAKSGPAVKSLEPGLTAVFFQRKLYLEIAQKPVTARHKSMNDFVKSEFRNSRKFLKSKGFRSTKPVYRYDWKYLSCHGRKRVFKSIFPDDTLSASGWEHRIIFSGKHGETLWRLAFWLTGSGSNSTRISKFNHINPKTLAVGKKLLIPEEMLDSCFLDSFCYPIATGDLVYQLDDKGIYAEYKLLRGQTIYSQVLKYTPRVTATEVLDASKLILARSNLKNFRTIPANFILKIPSELISPQFLPPNDPRRIKFDETDRESSKFTNRQKAKSLDGITVILDAGHGGIDPGAIGKGNIKEDEYAYDVMCRVKKILESETEATVYVTIKDKETGYTPRSDKLLSSGKNKEMITTTPPYMIEDTGIALNLRWILSNYIFTEKCNSKTRTGKVVFTSFHADSLHKSASGLMIYIPGADYYRGNIRKSARIYLSRKEAKGHTSVKTSRSERLQAEGFSKNMADMIVSQCKNSGLKMHSNQPIRKFVIRRNRSWVPALLRYCKIPTRLLVELANLQNTNDVKQIKNPVFREKLARMYVEALKSNYSD